MTDDLRIEIFTKVILQLGAALLRDRAIGCRHLKSLVATISKGLDNHDRISMLARLADFSSSHVVKSNRSSRLLATNILRCMFEVNVYRGVEGRVGALNLIHQVLEADRASDCDAGNVGAASAILGELAAKAALKPEFELLIIRYLEPALDWLVDPRYEIRRFTGALVLFQLLLHAPAMVYALYSVLMKRLWSALVDGTSFVREAALLATSSFLLDSQRRLDDAQALRLYQATTVLISRGLIENVSESEIHAALLLLRMVLKQASISRCSHSSLSWQMLRISEAKQASWCRAILDTRGIRAKDFAIRQLSLEIIPFLALLVPNSSLPRLEAAELILSTLQSGRESRVGYLALGRLSMVIAPCFVCSVRGPSVLRNLTSSIIGRLRAANRSMHCYNETVLCLAMFIKSTHVFSDLLRNRFVDQIGSCLPYIFDRVFTSSGIYMATTIFEILPTLCPVLQRHLFAELKTVVHDLSSSTLTMNQAYPRGEKLLAQIPRNDRKFSGLSDINRKRSRFYLACAMSLRVLGTPDGWGEIHPHRDPKQPMVTFAIAATALGCLGSADAALRYEIVMLCFHCLGLGVFHVSVTNMQYDNGVVGMIIERLILSASQETCIQIRSIVLSKLSFINKAGTLSTPRLLAAYRCILVRTELSIQEIGGQAFAKFVVRGSILFSHFLSMFLGTLLLGLRNNPLCQTSRYLSASDHLNEHIYIPALKSAQASLSKSRSTLGHDAKMLLAPVLEVFGTTTSNRVAIVTAIILGDLSTVTGASYSAAIESAIPRVIDILCDRSEPSLNDDRALVRALTQLVNATAAVATAVRWRAGRLFDVLWSGKNRLALKSDASTLTGSLGAISLHILGQTPRIASSKDTIGRLSSRAKQGINQRAIPISLHEEVLRELMNPSSFHDDDSTPPKIRLDLPKKHNLIVSIEDCAFSQYRVLSIQEHSQTTSFDTVLGMIAFFPELKREALLALAQVCNSFHSTALSLRIALSTVLSMLQLAISPVGEMLLLCFSQIITSAAPIMVADICRPNQVMRALAPHWSHSISGSGGIIAVILALKEKMGASAFSAVLPQLLPPLLSQLERSPFHVMRAVDLLSDAIASSGEAQAVLNLLVSQSSPHLSRLPGKRCLTMVCAIRLVHRIKISSKLFQMLPSFLFRLIDLITFDTRTQGSAEFINDIFLLLEVTVSGCMFAAHRLKLRFVPYVPTINAALARWLKLFENMTGTYRSALAESLLIYPTIRTSPPARINSAAGAIADYCSTVCTIIKGRSPLMPTRLVYILDGAFDKLIADMAGTGTTSQSPDGLEMVVPSILIPAPDPQALCQTLNTDALVSPEDWREWMQRVTVELLRQSKLLHLRACAPICEIHPPSASRLFQTAVLSTLSNSRASKVTILTEKLLCSLKNAVEGNFLPGDCVVMVLDLILFMRAHHNPLSVDCSQLVQFLTILDSSSSLGACFPEKVWTFEEHSHQVATVLDRSWIDCVIFKLRRLNSLLNYRGVLATAKILWYHATGSIHDGAVRQLSLSGSPRPKANVAAAAAVRAQWLRVNVLHEVATLGVRAAWALQNWDDMAIFLSFWDNFQYISVSKMGCAKCLAVAAARAHDKPHELLFYHAAFTVGHGSGYNRLCQAHNFLQAARLSYLHGPLRLNGTQILFLQCIQEMQEVIDHLATPATQRSDARIFLCRKWLRRVLLGAHSNPSHLSQLMMVRNLITPSKHADACVILASLCQNTDRSLACLATLGRLQPLLLRSSPSRSRVLFSAGHQPQFQSRTSKLIPNPGIFYRETNDVPTATETSLFVHYQTCLLLWEIGDNKSAYQYLFCLSRALMIDHRAVQKSASLLLSCLITRCEWCVAFAHFQFRRERYSCLCEARSLMSFAIQLESKSPQAWLTWGLTNYELLGMVQSVKGEYECCVAESVGGFLRGIELFDVTQVSRNDAVLVRAMLMLIRLWFRHGSKNPAVRALERGLAKSSVGIWLGVLPQLIARLEHSESGPRILLIHLLTRIGHVYPQALIYPITISGKSPLQSRRDTSLRILCNMQTAHDANKTLVAEAELIACELHRAASTWHETWFQGIETGANLLFGEKDLKMTLVHLSSLHASWRRECSVTNSGFVNNASEVGRILAFRHAHGCEIEEARQQLHRYLLGRHALGLHQAWDTYSTLHRCLKRRLLTAGCEILELSHIAPKLLSVRNLSLAVPGTHTGDSTRMLVLRNAIQHDITHIASFFLRAYIICSKQRPRRIRIHGSDGDSYDFLLKGNEDLRQDERVMQLCGLVNGLLVKAHKKCEPQVSAQGQMQVTRYAVMPLSSNSGLLEWVSNCCTIHSLIVEHRCRFSLQTDAETCCVEAIAPTYPKLTSSGKTDAFSFSLARTKGTDLARMLWLSAEDPDKWLSARRRFTLTLGLNSMVGYIIGLGDRHLSNIMVAHTTGDVVHIDFGDCFDVAVVRKKFPEHVPFRLTRQLTNVMDVGGAKGIFCLICNHAMKVMRADCLSLTAVLEALVHDPLMGICVCLPKFCWEPRRPMNETERYVLPLIRDKLAGRDVLSGSTAFVEAQVSILIDQAQSQLNVCQMFFGWCPFW